jgi:hypothetical protein
VHSTQQAQQAQHAKASQVLQAVWETRSMAVAVAVQARQETPTA